MGCKHPSCGCFKHDFAHFRQYRIFWGAKLGVALYERYNNSARLPDGQVIKKRKYDTFKGNTQTISSLFRRLGMPRNSCTRRWHSQDKPRGDFESANNQLFGKRPIIPHSLSLFQNHVTTHSWSQMSPTT